MNATPELHDCTKMLNPTAGAGYLKEPLTSLVAAIVDRRDERALAEVVARRTLFHWNGGVGCLPEFLLSLRNATIEHGASKRREELADTAYDLTLDKFSRLPSQECGDHADGVKRKGTDCRYYYRAFLRFCLSRLNIHMSLLQQENSSGWIFQRFVVRHYFLSLAEAARQTATVMHRYTWKTRGVSLCLYMPRAMAGEKRAWLETHIAVDEVGHPDARKRIQAIIDNHLRPLYSGMANKNAAFSLPSLPGVSIGDLAHAIAEEKADSIQNLRPSIRALGPDNLRRFILDIFERLKIDNYDEQMLARHYGLSRSSFTRFAGSRWSESDYEAEKLDPPDLWRNMARLLGERSDFVEAAKDAGVLDRVMMLSVPEPQPMKETANETN